MGSIVPRRNSSQQELPRAEPCWARGEGERRTKARDDPSIRGTTSLMPPPQVAQLLRKRKLVVRVLLKDKEDLNHAIDEVNIASQSSHEQSWKYVIINTICSH